jgi:hypothetical protein
VTGSKETIPCGMTLASHPSPSFGGGASEAGSQKGICSALSDEQRVHCGPPRSDDATAAASCSTAVSPRYSSASSSVRSCRLVMTFSRQLRRRSPHSARWRGCANPTVQRGTEGSGKSPGFIGSPNIPALESLPVSGVASRRQRPHDTGGEVLRGPVARPPPTRTSIFTRIGCRLTRSPPQPLGYGDAAVKFRSCDWFQGMVPGFRSNKRT